MLTLKKILIDNEFLLLYLIVKNFNLFRLSGN